MQMPKVSECSVSSCAYNDNKACHALAITVGEDPDTPICDTFFESDTPGGDKSATAGVGACKAAECEYNADLECTAPNIEVGMQGNEADCLTFNSRH
ncbi:MAG: DUF1540 domain-containing protein [Desulfuromonadales bacterium]|nr:DUF1540 domain-containing protein [Desulfuromonadales bacterium]